MHDIGIRLATNLTDTFPPPQLALASFFEDGADDDIVTLPQPEGGSSVSRSAGPR